MKKMLLCLTLLIALAFALTPSVFAADSEAPAAPLLNPYYMEFSGRVIEINPYYNLDGSESGKLFVLAQGPEEEMLMNFVVDESTYMLTEGELEVGADIVGFYLGNAPRLMIYPPRAHAALLAVNLPDYQSVKAALFDENLISDDNDLKLNIGEDTEILLQNGEAAPAGMNLGNRRLVVFYRFTTFSIPAQTAPSRVIVLDEEQALAEQPQAEQLPDEELPTEEYQVDGMPLAVENVLLLDAPAVYIHESGAVMIPLRDVAEALGYAVGCQNGTITLDGQTMAVIGQDGAELHDGITYVPLSFFREVLKMNNAFVFEKQVYIDNSEKME